MLLVLNEALVCRLKNFYRNATRRTEIHSATRYFEVHADLGNDSIFEKCANIARKESALLLYVQSYCALHLAYAHSTCFILIVCAASVVLQLCALYRQYFKSAHYIITTVRALHLRAQLLFVHKVFVRWVSQENNVCTLRPHTERFFGTDLTKYG